MAQKDDLKVATDDQLQQQLTELKREQFNLRFQSATNQLEKPSRVRVVRRTIARIRTLQRARTAETKNKTNGPKKSTGAGAATAKA